MGQVIERREAVQTDARFVRAQLRLARARGRAKELMAGSAAQGTTEYAILVGVLALALGEIVGSGAATLFGSDQTSGLGELGIN